MRAAGRVRAAAVTLVLISVAALVLAAPGVCRASWDGGSDVVGRPTPSREWYFAEGTTREGFEEWICLLNPGRAKVVASIDYMLSDGSLIEKSYPLRPGSRTTVDVRADVPGGVDMAARVRAPGPVVAERSVYFRYKGLWTGGHTVVGATETGTDWYFAEGSCRPGFETYFCVQNPSRARAEVRLSYQRGDGRVSVQEIDVEEGSRGTVAAADVIGTGDDPSHDFSARVESTNGVGIVVERPMYFAYRGAWTGGHAVVGATETGTDWYFAEGSCRPGFEPYLCVQNPGDARAEVSISYMLGDGTGRLQQIRVPKHSRRTVAVADVIGTGDDPSHDFSARVESTNGVGIVVERPMYFAYRGAWTGGHAVVGATETGTDWYFAEGSCRPGFEPYLCVQNPGKATAAVQVDYFLADGTARLQEFGVAGRSRYTVSVREILGEGDDPSHDFSCRVKSTNGAGLVVERPVYFSYESRVPWSMSAVGDVNLGGDMVPTLKANGFSYPWSAAGALLRETTIAFANLECTMSDRGSALPGKTFTFRGPPGALPAMRDAGVSVVSQANNHSRDYGGDALTDCLGHLEACGIGYCGAGVDYESAHRPAFVLAAGLRVAFLAYNDISYDGIPGWQARPGYPGVADASDRGRIAIDIAAARTQADLVVVSFHWGTERKYTPDGRQVDLAHFAVDCGADIVLGHHPHVVQGFEIYRGKPVAYSLGNFIFNPGSVEGRHTVLTRLRLRGREFESATIYPAYISGGRPQLLSGGDAATVLGRVAGLSGALGTRVTVSGDTATIP